MPYENVYEHFRTVLSVNLLTVTENHEQIKKILDMVDISMSGFEIQKKQMDIIPASGEATESAWTYKSADYADLCQTE